jgi:hypothetical protein
MSRVTRRANAHRRTPWRMTMRRLSELTSFTGRGAVSRRSRTSIGVYLIAGLAALALLVGVNAALERSRRTSATAIEVLNLDSFASPGKGARGGMDIRYRFDVAGTIYEFVEFRSWSIETISDAKVCYDPGDPNNRALARAEEPCP